MRVEQRIKALEEKYNPTKSLFIFTSNQKKDFTETINEHKLE